jgi:nucleoside-triphosphatase THEP1
MRIAKLALENAHTRDTIMRELGICDNEQEEIRQRLIESLASERPVIAIMIQPAGQQIEVSGFQGSMKAGMVHRETKMLNTSELSQESLQILGF